MIGPRGMMPRSRVLACRFSSTHDSARLNSPLLRNGRGRPKLFLPLGGLLRLAPRPIRVARSIRLPGQDGGGPWRRSASFRRSKTSSRARTGTPTPLRRSFSVFGVGHSPIRAMIHFKVFRHLWPRRERPWCTRCYRGSGFSRFRPYRTPCSNRPLQPTRYKEAIGWARCPSPQ